MTNKILIVVAHADDETIGCGGIIARHVKLGDDVRVIFMADGVTSRSGVTTKDTKSRIEAAENAKAILGYRKSYYLQLPDNRLDSLPLLDVIKPLETIIQEFGPRTIYTHHIGDLNIDHQVTFKAVLTACRPTPESTIKEFYTFEVMSSTEWSTYEESPFLPDVFIDIGLFWDQKQRALLAYKEEMRAAPHSRSIEHLDVLSKHRGSCVGLRRAEAFKLIRRVIS